MKCITCGKEFESDSVLEVRCKECTEKKAKEQDEKIAELKRRLEAAREKKLEQLRREKEKLCSERCRSCKYHGDFGVETACYYITKKHERRGCPPGDKCTKYEEGKVERVNLFYAEM